MCKKIFLLTACLLMLVLPQVILGQIQSSQLNKTKESEELLIKIGADLVALDVTVSDAKGNYVLDLAAADFELREDGELRPIEFFQPTSKLQNTSLALVIALDLSGSLSEEEIILQRESIKKFVEQLDKTSLCALMGFNHQVNILQDFTSDHKKLGDKLNKIKDYGGSTRIYDALDRAITMLKKAPTIRDKKRLRPVIVVITDGFDSSSIIDKKELIARAKVSGTSIYSITIPSFSPLITQGKKDRLPTLLDIAGITTLTGGRDFSLDNNNYNKVFEEIAKEFAASYTLAYHLPKDLVVNKSHKLEVKAKLLGLQIRTSRDNYQVQSK